MVIVVLFQILVCLQVSLIKNWGENAVWPFKMISQSTNGMQRAVWKLPSLDHSRTVIIKLSLYHQFGGSFLKLSWRMNLHEKAHVEWNFLILQTLVNHFPSFVFYCQLISHFTWKGRIISGKIPINVREISFVSTFKGLFSIQGPSQITMKSFWSFYSPINIPNYP